MRTYYFFRFQYSSEISRSVITPIQQSSQKIFHRKSTPRTAIFLTLNILPRLKYRLVGSGWIF